MVVDFFHWRFSLSFSSAATSDLQADDSESDLNHNDGNDGDNQTDF